MTQAYINQAYEIEIEENKEKATLNVIEMKADNSSGISNPRYYEHALTPKKAKITLAIQTRDYYPPLI